MSSHVKEAEVIRNLNSHNFDVKSILLRMRGHVPLRRAWQGNVRDSDDDDGYVDGDDKEKIRTNLILSFRYGSKQTSPFSAAFGQNAALSALPRLRWSL